MFAMIAKQKKFTIFYSYLGPIKQKAPIIKITLSILEVKYFLKSC